MKTLITTMILVISLNASGRDCSMLNKLPEHLCNFIDTTANELCKEGKYEEALQQLGKTALSSTFAAMDYSFLNTYIVAKQKCSVSE